MAGTDELLSKCVNRNLETLGRIEFRLWRHTLSVLQNKVYTLYESLNFLIYKNGNDNSAHLMVLNAIMMFFTMPSTGRAVGPAVHYF